MEYNDYFYTWVLGYLLPNYRHYFEGEPFGPPMVSWLYSKLFAGCLVGSRQASRCRNNARFRGESPGTKRILLTRFNNMDSARTPPPSMRWTWRKACFSNLDARHKALLAPAGWRLQDQGQEGDYELVTASEVSFHGAFQDRMSHSVPNGLDLLSLFRITKGLGVQEVWEMLLAVAFPFHFDGIRWPLSP